MRIANNIKTFIRICVVLSGLLPTITVYGMQKGIVEKTISGPDAIGYALGAERYKLNDTQSQTTLIASKTLFKNNIVKYYAEKYKTSEFWNPIHLKNYNEAEAEELFNRLKTRYERQDGQI